MDTGDLWVLLLWNARALLYDLVFVLTVIPALAENTEAEGISCIYFKGMGNMIILSLLEVSSALVGSTQLICGCESS